MAILPNGLETIDLGSTAWRDALNSNFEKLYTKNEVQNPINDTVYANSGKGVVLTDRTTGTRYRLFIDNGVLDIEAV
jgi:hypothetical protein